MTKRRDGLLFVPLKRCEALRPAEGGGSFSQPGESVCESSYNPSSSSASNTQEANVIQHQLTRNEADRFSISRLHPRLPENDMFFIFTLSTIDCPSVQPIRSKLGSSAAAEVLTSSFKVHLKFDTRDSNRGTMSFIKITVSLYLFRFLH